ncbi:MAG: hypothetical protein QXE01_11905 [Sulfolobales archaeon]
MGKKKENENELKAIELGKITILIPAKEMKKLEKLAEFMLILLPLLLSNLSHQMSELMADDEPNEQEMA